MSTRLLGEVDGSSTFCVAASHGVSGPGRWEAHRRLGSQAARGPARCPGSSPAHLLQVSPSLSGEQGCRELSHGVPGGISEMGMALLSAFLPDNKQGASQCP